LQIRSISIFEKCTIKELFEREETTEISNQSLLF
jgi:hypothetical protein